MRSDYEILRENIRQFRVQKLNKYFHLVCYILGSFRINLSLKKRTAQARNRTGGPTMATLDFTTKPLALVFL